MSQSKDQVSQTALSFLHYSSPVLMHYYNFFSVWAFCPKGCIEKTYAKAVLLLFDYLHIDCIIPPQLEQRRKLKYEMQETVSTNVNITPLNLVNTQSASPGEATPSRAGKVQWLPLGIYQKCTLIYVLGNIVCFCVLQPL